MKVNNFFLSKFLVSTYFKEPSVKSKFFRQSLNMKISRISFFYLFEFLQSLDVILSIFWKWGIKLMMYEIIKTLWTSFLWNSFFMISILQVKRIFIEENQCSHVLFQALGPKNAGNTTHTPAHRACRSQKNINSGLVQVWKISNFIQAKRETGIWCRLYWKSWFNSRNLGERMSCSDPVLEKKIISWHYGWKIWD